MVWELNTDEGETFLFALYFRRSSTEGGAEDWGWIRNLLPWSGWRRVSFESLSIIINLEPLLICPWNVWAVPFPQSTVTWVNAHWLLWGTLLQYILVTLQGTSFWRPGHFFNQRVLGLKTFQRNLWPKNDHSFFFYFFPRYK